MKGKYILEEQIMYIENNPKELAAMQEFHKGKKYGNWKKMILLAMGLLTAGILMSCGQSQETAGLKTEMEECSGEDEKKAEGNTESAEAFRASADDGVETAKEDAADMTQKFGETCIAEQTFEVELSEYSGKVWFVPCAPAEDGQDFSMQIIQNDETLTDIPAYVPESLAGECFQSLDAVSFYDVNYDGNTDIVLIETYGSTSFAAVYYGFDRDVDVYGRQFTLQEQLSETISGQAEQLTIPKIREFLALGKKNGEFAGFQEAYQAVSRLCELENEEEMGYDLICFDEDDIPELVTGVAGYYVSLYTYHDGMIYRLMDCWPYGAMGNAGYEYAPGKNSLRNYNSDYAGAILYTTYMTMNEQYVLDTVVQIETCNFDDVNQNGFPDENEEESLGYYSVSHIDGIEVSEEECASYEAGEYEYMEPKMNMEELQERLNER